MAGMGQSAAACAGRHSRGFNVRSNGVDRLDRGTTGGAELALRWFHDDDAIPTPRLTSRQLIKKFRFLNEFTSGECDGRASLKSLKLM
jgi:hypothetical protein